MRILEVNVDDIGHGGVYSFVMNVLRHKKDENITMDFCAFEKFESQIHIQEIEKLGGHVYYAGYEGNKLLKQFKCQKNLEEIVRKNKYDLVHIHSDVANKLLGYARACRKGGVEKIIVHSHSSGIDHGYRFIKEIFHRVSRPGLEKAADIYIACSEYAANWMYTRKLQNHHKVLIVNNGINVEKFKYNPELRYEWRTKLNLQGKLVVGHIGRFDYQKNHEYLIDVFAAIEKQFSDTVLLLIGEGEGKEAIKEKVDNLGLSEKVIFWGVTNQVAELLQIMDIFLLPSHFEGLPISGVEAQAAGLPVIFSDKITPEAKLTPNVEFASIDSKPEVWVEYAKALLKQERKDTSQILIAKGFDNLTSVNNLLKIYCEIGENE